MATVLQCPPCHRVTGRSVSDRFAKEVTQAGASLPTDHRRTGLRSSQSADNKDTAGLDPALLQTQVFCAFGPSGRFGPTAIVASSPPYADDDVHDVDLPPQTAEVTDPEGSLEYVSIGLYRQFISVDMEISTPTGEAAGASEMHRMVPWNSVQSPRTLPQPRPSLLSFIGTRSSASILTAISKLRSLSEPDLPEVSKSCFNSSICVATSDQEDPSAPKARSRSSQTLMRRIQKMIGVERTYAVDRLTDVPVSLCMSLLRGAEEARNRGLHRRVYTKSDSGEVQQLLVRWHVQRHRSRSSSRDSKSVSHQASKPSQYDWRLMQ